MKEAFELLTDSMDNKGDEKLLSLGKFEQTYHEGADELRAAPDLGATQYSTKVADTIKTKLETLTKDITPKNIEPAMTDMVDISSKFLAQNAEFNKKKGPALKLLTQQLRNKPNDKLIQKDKIQKTNAEAANDLEHARGLDSNHDDPILSKDINEKMSKLVEGVTPTDMKKEMAETLDTATKYLSQKAVDDNERGPAFELLIKELQKRGGEAFSDYPALSTKNAAAYTLSSAPGLTSVSPDPATAPEFKKALHKAIDAATPPAMRAEMKDVVNRCADYLSGFIRDRGPAMDALLGMMKSKPNNVIAKRNNYTMDYGTAAQEIENAPTLVPFLPVKDIADEIKQHITKDIKKVTPPELKVPMQTLIDDASKSLSQSVAMRSGAAGERYPMNFLAAVKDSLGAKPLYKTGEYGQTYADAAEELKHAGPILDSAIALASQMGLSKLDLETEEDPKFTEEDKQARDDLRQEIASQINKSMPSRLAPSVIEALQSTINKAAKHLAKIGSAKGKALHYLLDLMKKKKGAPLGKLQGYEQTMDDGRRRIKHAPTLTNAKVDKNTYDAVKGKLNALAAEDTSGEKIKLLPEMIDESAKFLSAPIPKTEAEKRSVLADLMGRKEDEVLGEDGIYKMSYSEGGKEIEKATVGVTKAHDEEKKKEMIKKMEDVMPDKRMRELLKEPIKEGAAHLTDVVKGRGEAMEVIHDSLKKENGKEFLNVGDFSATHEKAANMLADAPFFETDKASPVIMENVEHKVASLPKDIPPDKIMAKKHMEDTEKIAANYIAAEATKKSGLTPAELKELDEAGFNAEAKAAAEKRRLDAIEAGVSTKYGAKGEVGADGKPIGGVGPDGKPTGGVDTDGKPIAVAGPDGKPIGGGGPDGTSTGGVGPDGKPLKTIGPDGKPIASVGPDGKPLKTIGPDGKPIAGVAPDGKPHKTIGPDGKPIEGVGPDDKPIGGVGPDGKPITGVGPDGKPIAVVGPDGKPTAVVGPDGKPIAAVGPDGKPIAVMGPDGKPIAVMGPDGKPIAVVGPDGKPIAAVGPDGKPIAVMGPDGKPIAVMGPDGKPIAVVGPDGKPIAAVGPDGKPIAAVGPDGKPIAVMGPDGKPIAVMGPDGKPIAVVGPDGKPIAIMGPDGKPIAVTGPDGKPIAGVGPDGKPIAIMGPDGKPIAVMGPDGKPIAVVGPDGKPIAGVGPDGKPIAIMGPDGKPIAVMGPDGKPIAVVGPDGKPIAGVGPDGKPIAIMGPDGKPIAVMGPDGKPIAGVGPDGKPIAIMGPDGKPVAVMGPDGKPIAVVGPDGKPIAGVGPDGKPIAIMGPDGKPIAVMGPDGKPIAVVGPDGKPIAIMGPDGKPIAVLGPDGKPIAVVGPDGKPIAGVGPDGNPIAVVGPDGKPIAVMGPDGKPIAVVGPDGKPIAGVGPDGKPIAFVGPDGKPIAGVGPDGKPIAGVSADGKAEAGAGSSKKSGAGGTRDASYGPGGAEKGPGGAGYRQGGTGYGPGGTGYGPGFETEEQRRRRLAQAEEYRKYEEGERKRLGDKEYFRRLAEKSTGTGTGKYHGGALGADYDPEHEAALDILHRELRARGAEMFYEQPQTSLTHDQASDWLSMPYPMRVDKCVRDSADTARLYKKFEKKLGNLVHQVTPPDLYDSMQDVVIEGAQRLSEFFVATNFKAQVHEALISEMQKRGNEIFTEVDGAAETYFFAAQRLKKTKSINIHEPCYRIAEHLTKKLEDMIHTRSMPRKLMAAMNDHVKSAADYLSALVTKPDDQIEAYVALLGEMETAGDKPLIEGDIPKSYKEAAAYLRQLTSFEDKIGLPDSALQSAIQSKLRSLMSNVRPSGYSPHVMETVIVDTTGLLVSYIIFQGKKTEVLKALVREMDQAGDGMLLRHGPIRKSFKEGADLLRELNTDQLKVLRADNVASRKIQIKLNNLMIDKTPEHFQALMDDIIEETTMFLAVHLLQTQVVQVCKCMKNVFVQCELWCDEILRRVARPCCMCLRHVSTQALHDLPPALHVTPGSTQMYAPGIEISFKTCPAKPSTHSEPLRVCPASNPTPSCLRDTTTSYLLYSTTYKNFGYNSKPMGETPSSSSSTHNNSAVSSAPSRATLSKCSSPLKSALFFQAQEMQSLEHEIHEAVGDTSRSYFTPPSKVASGTTEGTGDTYPILDGQYSNFQVSSDIKSRITQARSGYSSPTPIISTGPMEDCHVMMVSLMWNMQAWRDWIQEIVDRALAYQPKPNINKEETADSWTSFHRRVLTEALQWRQYSIFSHQLTTQLVQRYNNKEIVSPMGAVRKTKTYLECQEDMLTIIDIFNRWTQWLTLVIKETESLLPAAGSDVPLQEMRWSHLKKKVSEYSKDWANYIMYMKVSWEQKYVELIAEFLPFSKDPGPVWVVSACGAVPSGAVAAGVYDGEVIWVARTTHRCTVLPAALFPSKHCCLVYAEGAVHRYTKYQVMCNAEVRWVAWRRGSIGGRAVRVAAGVHVGRVQYHGGHLLGAVHEPHYRCHVVIYGRPFAFNCYELLMLADGDE